MAAILCWPRYGIRAVSIAGMLVVVACAPTNYESPTAAVATTTGAAEQTSTPAPSPTTPAPSTTPASPRVSTVRVPRLVGLTLKQAQAMLSQHHLRWKLSYQATSRFRAGTVISQSMRPGTAVNPATVIALLIAKAPPPPPPPPSPTASAPSDCDPAYPRVCLHDGIGDYDCAGGSGNGPNYVTGPIQVRPPDPFDLDRDGDGIGCE
jgi:PASTA domain